MGYSSRKWLGFKQMIKEGDAAIPLETTLHAFRNQEKTKQRSTIVFRINSFNLKTYKIHLFFQKKEAVFLTLFYIIVFAILSFFFQDSTSTFEFVWLDGFWPQDKKLVKPTSLINTTFKTY